MAENDPFSLGDSDDEKETKPKEQTVPESNQPKKAAVEDSNDKEDKKEDSSK